MNALARTVSKTLVASLVMALAIVIVNSLWHGLGLADRGLAFTVLQVVVETGVGLLVFLGASALLKLEELRVLAHLILRRRKLAEAAA